MSEDILPTPIFEPDVDLEWLVGPDTEIVFTPDVTPEEEE